MLRRSVHDGHAISRRSVGSRLLERDGELDAIAAALHAAADGHGRMVVVAGPCGIGKSQLLESAREHAARSDVTTLSARCSELERSFPFGAARQLFEPLLLRPAPHTPAERRVAELAAAGRTNRDIAQSLFVSEKTVETHLARVFRKLAISSRRELPDLLRTARKAA